MLSRVRSENGSSAEHVLLVFFRRFLSFFFLLVDPCLSIVHQSRSQRNFLPYSARARQTPMVFWPPRPFFLSLPLHPVVFPPPASDRGHEGTFSAHHAPLPSLPSTSRHTARILHSGIRCARLAPSAAGEDRRGMSGSKKKRERERESKRFTAGCGLFISDDNSRVGCTLLFRFFRSFCFLLFLNCFSSSFFSTLFLFFLSPHELALSHGETSFRATAHGGPCTRPEREVL